MVDFTPFSAVLVNCQFCRLNNITFFFLLTNVLLQHPSVQTVSRFHVLSHVQRFLVVFLSGTSYPTSWIKCIFALSDVLILLAFVLEENIKRLISPYRLAPVFLVVFSIHTGVELGLYDSANHSNSQQGRTNGISGHGVREYKDDVQTSPCQLSEVLSIRKLRLRSKRQHIGGSFWSNREILGMLCTPALTITIRIISWLSRKDIYIPRKYCEFDAM